MGESATPLAIPATTTGSYFARHWRGELSLPKSYWVSGVLLFGFCCNLAMIVVVTLAIFALRATPALAFTVAVAYILLTLGAYVWAVVGIWRSANRRGGGWAMVARIVMIFSVLISLANVTRTIAAVRTVTQANQPEALQFSN